MLTVSLHPIIQNMVPLLTILTLDVTMHDTDTDTIQRFLFEHAPVRGEIVHLEKTFQTIMSQRAYPPGVRKLLGEAIVACLLLTSSIKFKGSLNLQFQGTSRLPLILVQCDHALHVRALAQYEASPDKNYYDDAFLAGQMMLSIQQENKTEPFQSMVPIKSASMAVNLMEYFAQSEQVATSVWLAVSEDKAAGMLLQLMPGEDSQQREQFWEYAVHLGQTITQDELLHLDNETLLHRLYHETELRLFEPRPTQFRCRCTVEKMKQVVKVLGEQDALELLKGRKSIEVTCEFCNHHYSFDPIDVTMIFREEKN